MGRILWIALLALAAGLLAGLVARFDATPGLSPREVGNGYPAQPSEPAIAGAPAAPDIIPGPAAPGGALAPARTTQPKALAGGGAISAVWANDGGDKVTQDELRARTGRRPVLNRLWDGSRIRLFGARNEVLAFNLVLEAAEQPANGVSVRLDGLAGPGGFRIGGGPAAGRDGIFAWADRDIELFLVRYLQIKGLSRMSYETYDERHVPERLRLPRNAGGAYAGQWADRPDHDKFYPDIAVPMELAPGFSIAAGQNQSVWADIYIPKDAPSGRYAGEIEVREGDALRYRVPVELTVRDFALPDMPASKTMVVISRSNIAQRYAGTPEPPPSSSEEALVRRVVDRHFLLAHRHKISLIDENAGADAWPQTRPRPEWEARLSGRLFKRANGYKGPGEGVGNDVFSIGTYGLWQSWWGGASKETLWRYTDAWEQWFREHHPGTARFLYLIDESEDYAQTEKWAGWMKSNPGPGRALRSFATADLLQAEKHMPSLDIVASWIALGDTAPWQAAVDRVKADPRKRLFLYNGMRPASGSFATEDGGVALRELPWGQYKKGVDRWFAWEATYYDDYQGGRGQTNVFETAQTFGGPPRFDAKLGMTGWNYSNGEGVLFYPGTDRLFPAESYGLEGPIASLRLKHWRRGIQDVDYLALAEAIDPNAVREIVQRMVPKVLWEVGVSDRSDPTWVSAPLSWSTDPDDWEAAREQLADIIDPP